MALYKLHPNQPRNGAKISYRDEAGIARKRHVQHGEKPFEGDSAQFDKWVSAGLLLRVRELPSGEVLVEDGARVKAAMPEPKRVVLHSTNPTATPPKPEPVAAAKPAPVAEPVAPKAESVGPGASIPPEKAMVGEEVSEEAVEKELGETTGEAAQSIAPTGSGAGDTTNGGDEPQSEPFPLNATAWSKEKWVQQAKLAGISLSDEELKLQKKDLAALIRSRGE